MKSKNLQKFIFSVLLLLMLFFALIGMVSCNATKKVNTSKQTFDSSAINILKDSVRNLKKEVQTLKQVISEKETTEIIFDNTFCPPCPQLPSIPQNLDLLNKDSINALIHDLNDLIQFQNNYMAGQDNKIKRLADGSIEYSGRLKSYKQSDEKKQEIINNLIRESDSLRDVLQQNNTTVAKVDEKKDVDKKTSILNWLNFLIIGFISGGLVCVTLDRKTKIFKLLP